VSMDIESLHRPCLAKIDARVSVLDGSARLTVVDVSRMPHGAR
jgi:hypothetical protein